MVTGAHDLTGVLLEGRYRVGEPIAVGGMSRVYRGTDTRLDRAVAVKVMDARLAADPAFRGRLEREARAMARIEHPGVIDVHDHGEHVDRASGPEPLVYLVMELVEGATLRSLLLERGALGVPEALAVLEPVLAALAAAHRHGLAHRDVKPENVLISRTGVVKVADFGLVTAAAAAGFTGTGVIMGTPAYLSPEQVLGEGIGPRTDVYAAGVLLFELLTGRPPYDSDNALSVVYRHVNTDVPAPSALVPGLPAELDGLVTRATRRAAEDRPADAETLLYAVRGVRASLGVPAVPVPVPAAAGASLGVPEPALPPPPPKATRAMTGADWLPPADDDATVAIDRPLPPAPVRRRRLPAGIGAVLLLGVLVGVLGWVLGGGHGVTTPSVVGLPESAARQVVSEAGLVAAVAERRDNTVPAGVVAGSDPAAGTEVGEGSRVTLTVSAGRPRVPPIPVGTPVPASEGLLREAELTLGREAATRRFHPTAPAGTVIGTVPAAGTELTIGTPVALVLSRGPAPERERERDTGDDGPGDLGGSLADAIQRQLERALGGG